MWLLVVPNGGSVSGEQCEGNRDMRVVVVEVR
jgi:hypothetical protein